ncbi:MAG: ribonucleoside-diphosphate reductase [Caudoviricetes sp.]|nr:MAG: ribonucleoside-diphosphate reductase [Caudoviricetes sp.]
MTAVTYETLSKERKQMQEAGLMPAHWSTGSWQLFKEKYLYKADNPREQYQRIARTLAAHTPDPALWTEKFFDIMWKGWLSPSTPILSNTGTTRGLPVSCAGVYFPDSIDEIYLAKREVALLTKHGFGTAGYLGDIRPRGSAISIGGKSSGVLPVIEGMESDMTYVAQGTTRRGAFAAYLPVDHGDFHEVIDYLIAHDDGVNIGWNWYDRNTHAIEVDGCEETDFRWQKLNKTRMVTGKGYMYFPDKVNRARPQMYVDKGMFVKAAQLCNEISLYNDIEHTYTCVLASMNGRFYHQWKNTDAVFVATVFLDCVAQEFIERAKNIRGLEKAVRFTKKSRALGLGLCGLHSLYMSDFIPFESLQATFLNVEIFKHLDSESLRASQWLASVYGEPEWCKGYGVANTHRLSIAPTKSTALIMGGVTEGINPEDGMVKTQRTAAGEVDRVNPEFLDYLKANGLYTKARIREVREAMGSCQGVDWLSDEAKAVFKTGFEIDPYAQIRQASQRGPSLCQWQSFNLFLSSDLGEEYITDVMWTIVEDENMHGCYYTYGKAGVQASNGECVACQ